MRSTREKRGKEGLTFLESRVKQDLYISTWVFHQKKESARRQGI